VRKVPVSDSSDYSFAKAVCLCTLLLLPHNSPAGRSLACNGYLFISRNFFALFVFLW
jgi:hypothetical protein